MCQVSASDTHQTLTATEEMIKPEDTSSLSIIKIKRKRTEDPLQALVIENSRLLKKTRSCLFKLKRTDEVSQIDVDNEDENILQPDIKYDGNGSLNLEGQKEEKKVFLLPRKRKELVFTPVNQNHKRFQSSFVTKSSETTAQKDVSQIEEEKFEVDDILLQMVDECLALENQKNPSSGTTHKDIQNGNNSSSPLFSSNHNLKTNENNNEQSSTYVYDVYEFTNSTDQLLNYSSVSQDMQTTSKIDLSRIGYIRFEDEELISLLDQEDENDSENLNNMTDDEDSNAEDFYKNDYPDNEDDDNSIIFNSNDYDYNEYDYDYGYEYDDNRFNEYGNHRLETSYSTSEDNKEYVDDIEDNNQQGDLKFKDIESIYKTFNKNHKNLVTTLSHLSLNEDRIADDSVSRGDDDDYYHSNESNDDNDSEIFKRNYFAPGDRDDPRAMHRDKIFGKLQKQIDKNKKK
ncbi:Iwr1p ASCRUDRAFT_75736 [Ascoidea rubescens DSM 1968]|uniref:Transcription factor Iwr1 domain-containing protein n=1 Tax=Ascoidea rubescens DSM 1968 TaxID=1344418 RepID=A0A1D2VHN1_9ASCO|nr:hypothetical protein ASCRUDRAFT_75736 [Ascoidea rubescens DSM 1968]ODV60987.1 hypothetical protein ASCRUDRAFT_75736 [Ascoidea rubescens DSM 1968]